MTKYIQQITATDTPAALAYLRDSLQPSKLVSRFGLDRLPNDYVRIDVVSASATPAARDFSTGWGNDGQACVDWLIEEAVGHVNRFTDAVVLLEDCVSSPFDPSVRDRVHPPYWNHKGRILWPVLGPRASYGDVEQAMAWSASIRVTAVFTRVPADFVTSGVSRDLTDEEFEYMAGAIEQVAVDAFDGDGYLVWRRRADER